MIQIKLRLNSNKPRTVYAANGKKFYLKPGQNVLDLDENDYRSLAKALRIDLDRFRTVSEKVKEPEKDETPVEENTSEEPKATETVSEDSNNEIAPEVVEEVSSEEAIKNTLSECTTEPVEYSEEQTAEIPADVEESFQERAEEHIEKSTDYSTWTYAQLKAEYKSITGTACKLKKAEVVAFLQEHHTDA